MTSLTPHVLLVSPDFHGYWQALSRALTALGCEVSVHRYDRAQSRTAAVANVISHRVGSSRLQDVVNQDLSRATIRTLDRARPDAVLVVKGDQLSDEWWQTLLDRRIPHCVWLYDELVNMAHELSLLARLDRVLSYSAADVATLRTAGVTTGQLPNGFDSLLPWRPRPVSAVSFIGARYPEREQVMVSLAARGVPVAAWGREWSPRLWDRARTARWRDDLPIPAHPDIPRDEYYGVMAGSTATLNIHGVHHQGLSMRTFEAPGVGALSMIDRDEVSTFYEPGAETVVFHEVDELVDLIGRAERDPEWSHGIRTAGIRRTEAEHTFVHRMQTVLDGWR